MQRPKPGESEDDLLKFQQEFLAGGGKSAATVKKADKRKSTPLDLDKKDVVEKDVVSIVDFPTEAPKLQTESNIPHKKSRFSQERKNKSSFCEDDDPEKRIDSQDTHMAAVLTKIIERDTHSIPVTSVLPCESGFPKVLHRGDIEQGKMPTNEKPKSLFAQQFSKMSAKDFGVMLREESSCHEELSSDSRSLTETGPHVAEGKGSTDTGSHVIKGTGLSATFGQDEARKIHKENLEKLASMSAEEVMEERRKLLEVMDPALVNFLMSRRSVKSQDAKVKCEDVHEPMDLGLKKEKQEHSVEQIDLPIKPNQDWLHMDKVETDKLSWLKDLPPPSTDHKETGTKARFSFNGNLILNDEEMDVKLGLHHHGDEPERAGYTLEELFHLCRSTNIQQRVLSLKTLANILAKTRQGDFEDLVNSPILTAVLNAGILFLVRWALDDSIESVAQEAVSVLHAITVSESDEVSLDRVLPWFQGHISPSFKTCKMTQEMTSQEIADEKPQETDADVLNKDVIYGLVMRMNILPRLLFILSKMRPQAPVVLQTLGILTRIVRHSPQLAYEVERCAGLVNLIMEDFLPTSWRDLDTSQPICDVYGVPVPCAMKFIRCLAQSGRNLAAKLLTSYHLRARLLRYLVEKDPQNLLLPKVEAFKLQTESLWTWRTCLSYGLSSDLFVDVFPYICSKLQSIQMVADDMSDQLSYKSDTAFICAMESVVVLAAQVDKQKYGNTSRKLSSDSEERLLPSITWSQVTDICQGVSSICNRCLKRLSQSYHIQKYNLDYVVSCVNFLSSYISSWSSHMSFDPTAGISTVENMFSEILEPFLKSLGFKSLLTTLRKYSSILNVTGSQKNVLTENLPGLGMTSQDGCITEPILHEHSPHGLATAVLRLLYIICIVHKGLQGKIITFLNEEENIRGYCNATSVSAKSNVTGYFTKLENLLQYYILKIKVLHNTEKDDPLTQQMTLRFITRLCDGDEFLAHDVLSTVMFSPHLWKLEEELMSNTIEDLRLTDTVHLRSATQEEVSFTHGHLLTDTLSSLSKIRATYLQTVSDQERVAFHSRQRFLLHPLDVQKLTTSTLSETLFPQDWIYLPLIQLYNKFSSVGGDVQNALSKSEVVTVANVLKWVHLVEKVHPQVTMSISVSVRLSRIMCTFLIGNDLFLDKTVYRYLTALLRLFTIPNVLDKMDFQEEIPGLVSFYDLYTVLLQQYEAVSFGDPLYSCYILIPMLQKHDIQLRKAVWNEHHGIFYSLRLSVKELLLPLDRFLHPEESDVELIRLYYQNLLSGKLKAQGSPVLYLIAIHHVNRFMYNQEKRHTRLKHTMIQHAEKCPNKDLCHHLLYYKMANPETDTGLEFYQELPPLRKYLLQQINSIHG